jgi:hypothetical protein
MNGNNRTFNYMYNGIEMNHSDNNTKSIRVLSEKYLEGTYQIDEQKTENVFKSAAHYIQKYYRPKKENCERYFFKRFPFFDWIRDYDLKSDLAKDLTAGLTVNKKKFF